MVRRIYHCILGISGPITSLEVKLIRLLDMGFSKFTSLGLTLGSVELKKLIPFFFYHSVNFKMDLKSNVYLVVCHAV